MICNINMSLYQKMIVAVVAFFSLKADASGFDVLGVRLGMPLQQAEKIIDEHFKEKPATKYYLRSQTIPSSAGKRKWLRDSVFKDAVLYILMESRSTPASSIDDLVALYYDDGAKNNALIAVHRILDLDAHGLTKHDLDRALRDKYGKTAWEWTPTPGPYGAYLWSNSAKHFRKPGRNPHHQFEEACGFDLSTVIRDGNNSADWWRNNWLDRSGAPPQFLYTIQSEDVHKTAEWSRKKSSSRTGWYQEYWPKYLTTRNKCGLVLKAKTHNRWVDTSRSLAYVALVDVARVLDIAAQASSEAGIKTLLDPSKRKKSVKF